MNAMTRCLAVPLIALSLACGSPATAAGNRTLSLSDQDAGRTVQVRVEDVVRVQLKEGSPVPGFSLIWDVSSGAPSVLRSVSIQRSATATSGPSRQDTYTALFRAATAGQAILIARGSTACEAMAKSHCPNRDFTITVLVSAA